MQRTRTRIAIAVTLVTLAASAAHAVVIRCEGGSGFPGSDAVVRVALDHSEEEVVAGTQNDLGFDPAVLSIAPDVDCAIDPAIGPGTDADKRLNSAVLPSGDAVRGLVVSLGSSNPIPAGDLYTCTFHVAADASVGEYTLANTHLVASSPDGTRLPVTGTDCVVSVGPTPTPTPRCRQDEDCPSGEVCVDGTCVTPTPTATPIGFCDKDEDCPEGQICVDHHCVTPTPTRTRTPIGFCNTNEDCPEGQVCVDHQCVTPTATPTQSATPTPRCRENSDCPSGEVCIDGMCTAATPTATPTAKRKSSGGGGCSCEIDPGAPARAADGLAVLLPALVLLLRWRSRRVAR